MTPRTSQCEVFWALLSNPKHSGVPEDSKSPTLGVLAFTPTLGQSGVATKGTVSTHREECANLDQSPYPHPTNIQALLWSYVLVRMILLF